MTLAFKSSQPIESVLSYSYVIAGLVPEWVTPWAVGIYTCHNFSHVDCI